MMCISLRCSEDEHEKCVNCACDSHKRKPPDPPSPPEDGPRPAPLDPSPRVAPAVERVKILTTAQAGWWNRID